MQVQLSTHAIGTSILQTIFLNLLCAYILSAWSLNSPVWKRIFMPRLFIAGRNAGLSGGSCESCSNPRDQLTKISHSEERKGQLPQWSGTCFLKAQCYTIILVYHIEEKAMPSIFKGSLVCIKGAQQHVTRNFRFHKHIVRKKIAGPNMRV